MDSYLDQLRQKSFQDLNDNIIKLKNYISKYSLLPVLERAFINDNYIYKNGNRVPNDDALISDYIADLFLSFQKDKSLDKPAEEIVNSIFDICMDIVGSSMLKEMLSSGEPEKFTNHNVLFQYTERTFYIPIMENILNNILEKKFLNIFYERTGFHLIDINLFRIAITSLIYDKYVKHLNTSNILFFTKEDLFAYISERSRIKFTMDRFESLLDYFEIKESDNTDYLPRANNPVSRKPVFKYGDKYICCNPLRLIKNELLILEDEFKKDQKLFTEFGLSKGQRFEELLCNILKVFFNSSEIYHGLTYCTPDKVKHEADIIVDTGTYLLIVEVKSKSFQEKGKQGNEGSYKRSINNLIADAHEQCKITYEYINNNEDAEFHNGKETVIISKKNYLDMYLITVELENLDAITSDLYETVEVYERNPILTFSMYDLYMIFDILEKGSLFLIYLEQRRRCVLEKKIHTSTELDYLSTFLIRDLVFDKIHGFEGDFDMISLSGCSTDIDNYYLQGKKKPQRKIAVGANIFLKQINDCDGKVGFTIEKEFLTASLKTQKDTLNKIRGLQKQASKGKSSVFSYILETNTMGISIICYKNETFISSLETIKSYVEEKKYEFKIKDWAFIGFTLKPNRVQVLYFI